MTYFFTIAGLLVITYVSLQFVGFTSLSRLILLVISFVTAASLYLIWDYYFLGLATIIIYCGAIAIIILFVIMMDPPIAQDLSTANATLPRTIWILVFIFAASIVLQGFHNDNSIRSFGLCNYLSHHFYDIFHLGYMIYIEFPSVLLLIATTLWIVMVGVIQILSHYRAILPIAFIHPI